MSRYSQERKEVVLKKLLPPHSRSLTEVATEEGISDATLYYWRKQLRESGAVVANSHTPSEHWSMKTKLAIVAATFSMKENELSQYCREAEAKKQAKADKHEIKELKNEFRFKEKALAETAALLVLRKKLRTFCEEEFEDY